MSDGPIIGIDLGTTNSVVAILLDGQPRVIQNSEGWSKTPSVVAFLDDGEIVVGEIAKRQAATNPRRTISSVKRLMGRSYSDLVRENFNPPFTLKTDGSDSVLIDVDGVGYTPQQISALILEKMKRSVEDAIGEPVSEAIITVPAHFDDLQRTATLEAANMAGLSVLRLINEPTAAAMAYGLGENKEELIAVYDFGGGTFDISILELDNKTFEVVNCAGDTSLGGDDLDKLLADYILQKYEEEQGQPLELDASGSRRLLDAAEKAKRDLSSLWQTTISLPFISIIDSHPIHLERVVKREEFEALIADRVQRTIDICRRTLVESKLKIRDIKKVILVGGTTRIPLVQEMVEKFFGNPPFKGVNPDEIVALGAATQGGVLSGALQEVLLLDVNPHSLGLEVKNSRTSVVIEKNATIPVKVAKIFTTTEDNQAFVNIHVLQGESENAHENRSLGKFVLSDIPPARAGEPRIKVTFFINSDGVVEISANEMSSGSHESLTIAHTFLDAVEKETIRRHFEKKLRRPQSDTPIPTDVRQDFDEIAQVPYQEDTAVAAAAHAEKMLWSEAMTEVQGLLKLAEPDEADLAKITNAIPVFESHVAQHPADHQAQLCLARACLAADLIEECRAHLNLLRTADLPLRNSAMTVFDALLKKVPHHLEARYDKVNFALELNDISAVVEELEFLQQQELPEDKTIGKLTTACKTLMADKSDSTIQFRLVNVMLGLDKLDDSIEILRRLAKSSRYHDKALRSLGMCYWRKNMHELAWQTLRDLPMDAELKDILYRLAGEMESIELFASAREAYFLILNDGQKYLDAQERLRKVDARMRLREEEMQQTQSVPEQRFELGDSRFALIEEINRGSMGIVYKAQDRILDEVVALKVLNTALTSDPASVERFKQEARAARRLSHPNIIRIHDFFEAGEKKFLSMEYLDGEDLKKILLRKKRFAEEETRMLMIEVLRALDYAHRLGVIHRDIKPANIMLSVKQEVKVADFGIAKILTNDDATKTCAMIVGTPLYMSPEQIEGGRGIDARSDIYSLGISCYELLSGKPPFRDGNIEYHHIHTQAPDLPAEISGAMQHFVMKCIEKPQDKRFQTSRDALNYLNSLD